MSADRSWVFIVPVEELYLTEAVGREFRVDRVTLVHKDKLPRVRKRLGFGAPVSKLKKNRWISKDIFEKAEAFAVVRESGEQEEVQQRCLKLVREELSLLSLSQLGYSSRKQMGPVVPAGEVRQASMSYLVARSRDLTGVRVRWQRTVPTVQMVLDGRWKNYQDTVFFTKLLKILRGKTKVAAGWRRELRRASVMIGESVGANDLLKSFVWNIVALEMLLTKDEREMLETLPRRAEALLGWVFLWAAEDYEGRIREVYVKRNRLLHQGRRDHITPKDLAFTDHLLVNLLLNLVGNPRLFGSKEGVLAFAERVEAERKLGVKPRVRPRDLRFIQSIQPDF